MTLSQQTIEVLAAYLKKTALYGKKQLRLTFTNKEAGAEAKELLQRDLQGFITRIADDGGPKIFRLVFPDSSKRSEFLSYMNSAVAEYNATDGPKVGEKLTQWVLYLGIGVLLIVIVVLLWRKFKA